MSGIFTVEVKVEATLTLVEATLTLIEWMWLDFHQIKYILNLLIYFLIIR